MKRKMFVFFVLLGVIIGVKNVDAAVSVTNPNIVVVYKYNETLGASDYCVTGEESTCQKLTDLDSLTAGTIVKYKVSDNDEVVFHVMYDNGETLTMQSQKNIVSNEKWYERNSNSSGPMLILSALESATASWTNVNNQTYTLGVTVFKDNAYTGCTVGSCTTNVYTLPVRTAKARMIAVQEAFFFGCGSAKNSCPVWMHNYLYKSTDYKGTVNYDVMDSVTESYSYGYWTFGGSPDESDLVVTINNFGGLLNSEPNDTSYGSRVVVVIDKYMEVESKSAEGNTNIVISSASSTIKKINRLVVESFSIDSDVHQRIFKIFKDKKSVVAYDFKLYDSANQLIEPDSMVAVTIKLDNNISSEKLKVWYIDDKFNQTELDYTINNNEVSFETDHFSVYALTIDSDSQVVQVEDTALNSSILVLILGTIVMIVGMIIIMKLYSKKHKKN